MSSETLPMDDDTIVVSNRPNGQLLTPDDSATDASSQASEELNIKKISQGQGKRVTRVSMGRSDIRLVKTEEDLQDNMRNVSGKTLVPSGSESSLLRNGIDALNMDWTLSRADLSVPGNRNKSMDSLDTINVVQPESDSLDKKFSAREIKEKAEQERQAKYKAADEKATRRSSRLSIIERAGSLVSDITASANTLGKRSHTAMERGKDRLGSLKRTGSLRPRSAVLTPEVSISSFEGPTTKRRRVSEPVLKSDMSIVIVAPTPSAEPNQSSLPRPYKPKKFLASGLYAGQVRDLSTQRSKAQKKGRKSIPAGEELSVKENSILPLPMFACERLWNIGTDFKLPFDVFSPLQSSRPKADEWRKLSKNTFVGDAAAYWRGNDPLLKQFRSLCGCSATPGCDEDCQNRIMFYECNESNCSLGSKDCGNRSFAELKARVKKGGKYAVGVEVIKTVDRGYGVRANRTFRPNQIIVEYSGEIITQEETEHRMRTTYKDNDHYYLMLFDSALVIDATARGSIARFVNHSCEPNCRMEKWTVDGKPRMALFANGERGIMTGEELTYDYNFDPFCARNVQECRCGSLGCRGILGKRAPEKKSSDKTNAKEKTTDKKSGILAGAKRKLQSVLDEGSLALNLNKSKKPKTTGITPSAKSRGSVKVSKKVARSPGKRNVSFASTKSSPQRRKAQVAKPRNSSGPHNTPVASRAVSANSAKKATSTPAVSTASKKIKGRIQTPGIKNSGSISSLKGLLSRSNSKAFKKSQGSWEERQQLVRNSNLK